LGGAYKLRFRNGSGDSVSQKRRKFIVKLFTYNKDILFIFHFSFFIFHFSLVFNRQEENHSMDQVVVQVKLTNSLDEMLARRGKLEENQIRCSELAFW
jgi:hypothetical protein